MADSSPADRAVTVKYLGPDRHELFDHVIDVGTSVQSVPVGEEEVEADGVSASGGPVSVSPAQSTDGCLCHHCLVVTDACI